MPSCDACGGLVRPNVVWFGEPLNPDLLRRAESALARAQAVLVVSTSAVVQPAASFALSARRAGAAIVESNPDPTPLTSHCDFSLSGPAGVVLPRLLSLVERSSIKKSLDRFLTDDTYI